MDVGPAPREVRRRWPPCWTFPWCWWWRPPGRPAPWPPWCAVSGTTGRRRCAWPGWCSTGWAASGTGPCYWRPWPASRFPCWGCCRATPPWSSPPATWDSCRPRTFTTWESDSRSGWSWRGATWISKGSGHCCPLWPPIPASAIRSVPWWARHPPGQTCRWPSPPTPRSTSATRKPPNCCRRWDSNR